MDQTFFTSLFWNNSFSIVVMFCFILWFPMNIRRSVAQIICSQHAQIKIKYIFLCRNDISRIPKVAWMKNIWFTKQRNFTELLLWLLIELLIELMAGWCFDLLFNIAFTNHTCSIFQDKIHNFLLEFVCQWMFSFSYSNKITSVQDTFWCSLQSLQNNHDSMLTEMVSNVLGNSNAL